MFARRQPVIEAMDRAAECFWKPVFWLFRVKPFQIIENGQLGNPRQRQRSYRYLPLFLLLICLVGLGLMIAGWPLSAMLTIINLGFTFTTQIANRSPLGPNALGPRFQSRDERETALHRLGHVWGLFVVAVLAVIGCLYFAFAQPLAQAGGESLAMAVTTHRLWFPTNPTEWLVLALLLITMEINIAVLVTSWSVPKLDPDNED